MTSVRELASRLWLAASTSTIVALALTTGCRASPVYTMDVSPQLGLTADAEARAAFAAWQACTPALLLVPAGGDPIHVIVKSPEDGYADVVGTLVRLPLSGYLRSPERRVPLLAHELGHRFGLRHTEGDEPAIMSATHVSLVVTRRDCADLCSLYACPGGPRVR